jgi:hypothetical protein
MVVYVAAVAACSASVPQFVLNDVMCLLYLSIDLWGSACPPGAVPNAGCQQLYDEVAHELAGSANLLAQVKAYDGCETVIKAALSTPSKDTEDAAFAKVRENVICLQQFYLHAKALGMRESIVSLFDMLVSGAPHA